MPDIGPEMSTGMRLFISHSGHDTAVVEALVELIQNALNLPASAIRCTSVDGYRLPGGANTDQQLRAETVTTEAFIGLISPHSVRSLYVAFELGARWGTNKHLLPMLAPGVDASVLEGPLTGLNTLRCDSRPQLHQMVDELAQRLGVTSASPAVYERYIYRLLSLLPPNHPASGPTQVTSVISLSSFLTHLMSFASESNKLRHISTTPDLLPNNISFDELASLLRQFESESNRLAAVRLLRPKLARPSERDLEDLISLFNSESNKHEAIKLVR